MIIGIQKVVMTRRTKFMSMSELTPDYMDTTGYTSKIPRSSVSSSVSSYIIGALSSIEGELTSGYLISMIIEMGQFGLASGILSEFVAVYSTIC